MISPTRVDVSSPTHDTCVSARNLAGVSDMIGNPGSFVRGERCCGTGRNM